ncbi:M60 family metallopeptidase [Sunxiuqinia elliptica]|uniref:F5/8 type C domain-containing protein n=1 Tax=Sunxiuqinia elliptica TaxID=655355 RepID=A0A4V3BXF4_9BACT|nr:M60 family metallopeptidase [Sunxiuqinia elliptica]TDN98408.1 F5/8 type C domain-containing protein [Sunxiuqinia elliptica]TDO60511.1 F5/8 type C domain-containing protein [Sunxiuqinia elliptica]
MATTIFKGKTWIYVLLMVFIAGIQSCDTDDALDVGPKGWLKVLPFELDFGPSGGSQSVYLVLTNDIDTANITYSVSANGEDWCSLERKNEHIHVTTTSNYVETPRNTVITIEYDQYSRQIPVSQSAAKGDQLISVASATATTEETVKEDRAVSYSYDGDPTTYFNSKFGAVTNWPFQIEYTLEQGHRLDRIIYHPRSDAGNKWGSLNKYEVWASTNDNPGKFTKVGEYERGDANHNITTMKLETPVENVAKVRFDIYSSYQSRISVAEMEFYEEGTARFDYSTIFADNIYTVLKEGVTEKQIKAIPEDDYKELALDLFYDEYDTEFRVAAYRPYQNPSIQAGINKTSPYSLRDNPTGIYVEEGDELLVIVGNIKGQNLSMVVQDLNVGFRSAAQYALQQGDNRLTMNSSGLIYIQNFTDDGIPLVLESDEDKAAAEAKTVDIHFVNGKVNGYFDLAKHSSADWSDILAKATYQDIDLLGLRSHITWTTQNFRTFNTDVVSVLQKYDRLVYLEAEFAGLEKYNKMFNNRMYFHIDYNGKSPYATSYRTAYTANYAEIFCNASRFEARLWGPAHEVGHVNQLRPAFKWAGTTEITNNIMSMYVQTEFGEDSKLLVDGTYADAKNKIIETGAPHCLNNTSGEFMIRLVPFWQLKLYMIDALGKKDFYKDLYEHYRVTDAPNTSSDTQGILQLDFVRQVCRISGLNMVDFFKKWGFLTPVDKTINDYGNKAFRITQPQINNLIDEINAAGYASPHANVEDIQDNNIDQFKK